MIVVFDSQCLLCNGWVQFLLRHDRKAFKFAAIQGTAGQKLLSHAGLEVDGLETLLLVDGRRTWRHTAAIFRVLHALGGMAPGLARMAGARAHQGTLYRLVARNRYRVFGRTEVCILPPPDYAERFLD